MSAVNAVTDGETVIRNTDPLTPAEAQHLVGQINATVADLLDLVERLYRGRGWEALGYQSWADLCRAEIVVPKLDRTDRAELVQALRGMGLSSRAIGPALGISKDTVMRDLATVSDETVDEVVGLDGRRRPARSLTRVNNLTPQQLADTAQDMIVVCAGHDRVRLGDLADGLALDLPNLLWLDDGWVYTDAAVLWLTDLCAWLAGEQPADPWPVESWVAQQLGPCTTTAEQLAECEMSINVCLTQSALVARMGAAR